MKSRKQGESKLWIESHRWLLYFFASKNPLTALLFVFPMLTFWFVKINFYSMPLMQTIFIFLSGVFSWTLLEYCIHRFIFHWTPKNITVRNAVESIHIYHHRNIEDQGVITSGPVFAFFWSGINFFLFYLITGDLSRTSLLMFGLTSAYYFYEWVHYLVHHHNFSGGIFKYLQDYHLLHHEAWGGNYGQTSPIWDFVFKTNLATKKIESEKKKKYIFLYQKNLNNI
jgi:hypothetical protein